MRSSSTVRNLTPDRKHSGSSRGRIALEATFPEDAKKHSANGTRRRSYAEVPGDEIKPRKEG